MGRMTLMTGGDRRRQWSREERARILAEIAEPGAVVAEVARRADVCTSLVYKWRREALRREAASRFAPVVIEPAPAVLASATAAKVEDAAAIIVEVRDARRTHTRRAADFPRAREAAGVYSEVWG